MAKTSTLRKIRSGDKDTRVEDYINDKFQTYDDFDTLETLIANVQVQQDLLNKQVRIRRGLWKHYIDGQVAPRCRTRTQRGGRSI